MGQGLYGSSAVVTSGTAGRGALEGCNVSAHGSTGNRTTIGMDQNELIFLVRNHWHKIQGKDNYLQGKQQYPKMNLKTAV